LIKGVNALGKFYTWLECTDFFEKWNRVYHYNKVWQGTDVWNSSVWLSYFRNEFLAWQVHNMRDIDIYEKKT